MATKIRQSNLDATVISGNTEHSAAAAADDVLLVFDTSSGTLKKISASNVGIIPPSITSISPTNVLSGDGTGNHTIVITGKRFSADATATLIKTGGSALAFNSVTRNSATQITGVIAKSSVLNADEPFDVKVTTEGGVLSNTLENALTLNASPVFVTAAGSLGSTQESTSGSFSVNATDPESAGNVTFELQSGSLPPNFTLVNTAAEGGTAIISGTAGTVSATTTYNFVLRAVDAASNTTSRAFSIAINNTPVSTSFTSDGTFAVPSGVTTCDVLVVAGGGAGNSQTPHPAHRGGSGGGGAGGLIFMPGYPLTPGGTITVTVGDGSTGGGSATSPGQYSVFGAPGDPGFSPSSAVLTAIGGGKGGCAYSGEGSHSDGRPGGSGGGANRSTGPGTAVQPTQPGNSGAYGFGNNGGQGSTTSGGGGGGAGAVGANGPSPQAGGAGKAYTIADGTTSVYYAGGGGGGTHSGGTGAGGQGGGGGGSATTDGQANKGGGGSGSTQTGQGSSTGGKGIIVVRY